MVGNPKQKKNNAVAVKDQQNEQNTIATNDSSIVSKRSAERAGYFEEKQFLEYFVKKPQKRAPLIHLGYYVRCWAIDNAIRKYLEWTKDKGNERVAIVNLGCGYDPSFFRLAHRTYPSATMPQKLLYVDVDYPALIERKRDFVKNNVQELLGNNIVQDSTDGSSYIVQNDNSEQVHTYKLVPRDLSDSKNVAQDLQALGISGMPILFISEVATVYMKAQQATELFQVLSSTFQMSSLCLLEQVLPDYHLGGSAYQDMMLNHFERNVKTPLYGATMYPTIQDKCQRLYDKSDWKTLRYVTLDDIWKSDSFTDTKDRILEKEPFDEWEELLLFLKHYCIIYASGADELDTLFRDGYFNNYNVPERQDGYPDLQDMFESFPPSLRLQQQDLIVTDSCHQQDIKVSRRGHTSTSIGKSQVVILGGYGKPSLVSKNNNNNNNKDVRLCDAEILKFDKNNTISVAKFGSTSGEDNINKIMGTRMHHSATLIDDKKIVVFGGRRGPTEALNDLYVLHLGTQKCQVIKFDEDQDVPTPRFRHATFALGNHGLVVHGGIGPKGQVLSDAWFLDTDAYLWQKLDDKFDFGPVHSHQLVSVYSPDIGIDFGVNSSSSTTTSSPLGGAKLYPYFVCCIGGVSSDGQFYSQKGLHLALAKLKEAKFVRCASEWSMTYFHDYPWSRNLEQVLKRCGCSVTVQFKKPCKDNDYGWNLIVMGGIFEQEYKNKNVNNSNRMPDVVILEMSGTRYLRYEKVQWPATRRLWIEHDICTIKDQEDDEQERILITGGGGTCFSFGTLMDEEVVVVHDVTKKLPFAGQPISIGKISSSTKHDQKHKNKQQSEQIQTQAQIQAQRQSQSQGPRERKQLRAGPIPIVEAKQLGREQWLDIIKEQRPVVIKNMNLGSCTEKWTAEYLKKECGERKISVHVKEGESKDEKEKESKETKSNYNNGRDENENATEEEKEQRRGLSWHDRNFEYQIMTMKDFLDRVYSSKDDGSTVYLRSLSSKSARKPANLDNDFPEISKDFTVESSMRPELVDQAFSSILRISSKSTGIWAHYDVYDNVLTQISGKKKVRMWDPREADKMYLEGSSSRIGEEGGFSYEKELYPLLEYTHPIETELEEGDGVYIPACWVHTTQSEGPSIGINIFFGDAGNKTKDVWGNVDGLEEFFARRDALLAVQRHLSSLAPGRRALYAHKVAKAITEMAKSDSDELWNGAASM